MTDEDEVAEFRPVGFRVGQAMVDLGRVGNPERLAQLKHTYAEMMERQKTRALNDIVAVCEQLQQSVTRAEAAFLLDVSNGDDLDAIEKITSTGGQHIGTIREMMKKQQQEEQQQQQEEEEDDDDESFCNKRIRKGPKVVEAPRLRLDDALQDTVNMTGWSEARKKAYAQIDTNPNAYYYRFNKPGEAQRNGLWTKEESDMFFARVAEVGITGQWGIFSIPIPGRVGYQCSNYYRSLVKSGVVKDPNYQVMPDGKLVYMFKSRTEKPVSRTVVVKRHRKRSREESDDGDDEPAPFVAKETPTLALLNPLPNFIDPITQLPVVRPAISPYGHVAGLDTWCYLLKQEPVNTCPFTKQPLTRRELVKLSHENIREYESKIVNRSALA